MIGNGYWSTGISLKYSEGHGWSAKCKFLDNGFCQDKSTEGKLYSRYFGPLEVVIDNVKADAEKLGIEFQEPVIYGHADGESKKWPLPPNWKTILKGQADRIGWGFPYCLEKEDSENADIFQAVMGKEAGNNWLICWTGQDEIGNHWNVTTDKIHAYELYKYTDGPEKDAELIAKLLNEHYQGGDDTT